MISCGDHGRVSPYPVAQINCDARRVRTLIHRPTHAVPARRVAQAFAPSRGRGHLLLAAELAVCPPGARYSPDNFVRGSRFAAA